MRFIRLTLFIFLLLLAACAIRKPHSKPVIEVVVFYVRAGVPDAAVVRLARQTNTVVSSLPGFMHRIIAKGQQPHQWVDMVWWQSLPQAISAAAKMQNNAYMKRYVSLMRNYVMYHFNIKSQLTVLRK